MISLQSARVGKRGAIVVPARLRKRFGIEEGSVVTAEETENGILIRPAVVVPVERYSPERQAEFLLSNTTTEADYRKARRAVRQLGPAITAQRPLSFFAYGLGEVTALENGGPDFQTHYGMLQTLKSWGFPVNAIATRCSSDTWRPPPSSPERSSPWSALNVALGLMVKYTPKSKGSTRPRRTMDSV